MIKGPRHRNYVDVWLNHQSTAITHDRVKNTYQKGDMFCILLETRVVYKYPLQNIFRVKEYHS